MLKERLQVHGVKDIKEIRTSRRRNNILDEIGEVPPEMQVALLRVLQERTVTPIGSSKEVPVNIRIITATHKDLLRLVEEGNSVKIYIIVYMFIRYMFHR